MSSMLCSRRDILTRSWDSASLKKNNKKPKKIKTKQQKTKIKQNWHFIIRKAENPILGDQERLLRNH